MKNKTKTYLLLVTVLAIWGVIGFKMVATLNPDTPKVTRQDDMVLFSPKSKMANDTFSIQLSERDPFLGTLHIKKKPEISQKKITQKDTIVWILSYIMEQSQNKVLNKKYMWCLLTGNNIL